MKRLSAAKHRLDVTLQQLQEKKREYTSKMETIRLMEIDISEIAREKESTYLSLLNAEQKISHLTAEQSNLQQEQDAQMERLIDEYLVRRKAIRNTLFSSPSNENSSSKLQE